MCGLPLGSLEIVNYRALTRARIEHLGRVNLIVGRNNAGKSSVLEALRLYTNPADRHTLIDILVNRDEFVDESHEGRERFLPVSSFFGGHEIDRKALEIVVGPAGGDGVFVNILSDSDSGPGLIHSLKFEVVVKSVSSNTNYPCKLYLGRGDSESLQVRQYRSQVASILPPSRYVSPDGFVVSRIEELWEEIHLTPKQDEVLRALRLVAPGIEQVGFKRADRFSSRRVPFVKLEGSEVATPLRSLGDGVHRVFGLVLAMIFCKDGLLLVDEIENGLHYSVMSELWRFVIEAAANLGVQVFATTHSSDCIRSFQQAARESPEEGVLIRLVRRGDQTVVAEFNEEELGIAVEGGIEVR